MAPAAAVAAVILSAQTLGVDPSALPPPPSAPARVVMTSIWAGKGARVPLSEVETAQDNAFKRYGSLELAGAIGPGYEIWLKVRGGGVLGVFSPKELRRGVSFEGTRLLLRDQTFSVEPPLGPPIAVPKMELIADLYAAAVRVEFPGPVHYALLYDPAGKMPRAVAMIRQEGNNFFLTYTSAAEAETQTLFLAVEDEIFGLRLEKDAIVFFSKPLSH